MTIIRSTLKLAFCSVLVFKKGDLKPRAALPATIQALYGHTGTIDVQIPALHELARAALRLLFNGDTSQWDRALQMPHYKRRSMPAISMHTGMHLIQARHAAWDACAALRRCQWWPACTAEQAVHQNTTMPAVAEAVWSVLGNTVVWVVDSAVGRGELLPWRCCVFTGKSQQMSRKMLGPRQDLICGLYDFTQWARSGRFRLFSYGSTASNVAHYGAPEPPDIAANYSRLDIPVDIMAGVSALSSLLPRPTILVCYFPRINPLFP